jgi:alpha-1,6-mannosyltransferase
MASRTADDAWGRRRGRRALAWSALTLAGFAVFGSARGSPFQPELPRGGTPAGPLAWLASGFGLNRMPDILAVFLGVAVVVVAAVAFVGLFRQAIAGNVPARHVLWLALGAHVLLLFMPLVYSRDVYSYAMYGRIVAVYDENPYLRTPIDFGGDPMLDLVGEKWLDTPPVYGPAFVTFSALVARAADTPIEHVNVYRVLAIAASLTTIAVLVPTVRRLRPEWEAAALVAFGANPVILFHSVASGHNDLLVALSILGALALVLRGRELPAVAVLSVAALVKATAALPLLLLIVWCAGRRPRGERLRALVARVALAASIAVVFAAPYWQTRDPTLGMFELAGHTGWLAPSVFLTRLVEVASLNTLGWLLRVTFAVTLLVGVVAIAREVWRRAPSMDAVELGASWGWALVLLMVLGPVLLPWYVSWSLPLVWLLPRAPRSTLLVTGVALGVSLWSTEPERSQTAFDINLWIGHWIITPVVSVLVIRTLRDLWRLVRERLAFADVGVGADAPRAEEPERVPAAAGQG